MSKAIVARVLAKRVVDGDVLGLGSGSTAEEAVRQIGERIRREGIRVSGVPTSHEIAMLAQDQGIQVLSSVSQVRLNWAFDGADEVDSSFRMIKGRGAAMLAEKIIAERAEGRLFIVVTEEKLVDRLGSKFAVPIEVIPEAIMLVMPALRALGAAEVIVRKATTKYGPTISEHNNLIVDARFDRIEDDLPVRIKNLTGVVEHGLFFGYTNEVFVAKSDGVWSRKLANGAITEVKVDGS